MAPSLITSYYVQLSPQGTSALVTPSFTPSNGEVLVVKLVTWDTNVAMGAPTGGSQTYTSRVINVPGGFNQWCGIYTAVISGSPGSMTVSSTPAASARASMVVERWSGAQLAASPVTASSVSAGAPASGSITPSSGTSVISWAAGDAQSVDPATKTYLNSATNEGIRDDHLGSNGVDYHAWAASTGSTSQSYGLSAPTGMTYVTVAIEVQASGGAVQSPARQPLVVSAVAPVQAGQPILLRNTAALIVAPAKGVAPIVVTQQGPAPAASALLFRGMLADPPTLTTRPPLVATQPSLPSAAAAILVRNPAPATAAPVASTPSPYVVTAPVPAPAAVALLLRGSLADAPVLTTASPMVVTAPVSSPRPAAILVRPLPADAATPRPVVVTAAVPAAPAAAILVRNPQAPFVQTPATTPGPIVVTSTAAAPTAEVLLIRGSLADAPVLTTGSPLVVTRPVRAAPAAVWLIRNPPPGVAPVSGPTTKPIVVTAVRPAPPGLTVLIRGTGIACDCTTHRPNLGTTIRPSSGITAWPGAGTTTRPSSGITTRPDSGTTSRPCSCND